MSFQPEPEVGTEKHNKSVLAKRNEKRKFMITKSNIMNMANKEEGCLSRLETFNFLSKFYNLRETTMSVEIISSCNLRCPGCWVKNSHNLSTARTIEVMDVGILERTLKFGRNMGISKISLLGGEPTLHPQLPEIIKKAYALGYEKVSITTNGVFASSKIEELAASNLSNISFSIDGSTPEMHNMIRPSMNGRDTFSVTINNLRKALIYSKEYGFTVTVNHTIFPANFHDTESMIKFVASIGVKRCRLHFTFPGDGERNVAVKDVNAHNQDNGTYILPEDWLALYDRCKTLSRLLGIEIQIARVYGRSEVAKTMAIKAPYLDVLPNGKLLMCSTHSRLSNKERHTFATIADERSIELNKGCILFNSSSKSTCCKAIPELVKQLPDHVRNRIKRLGMGCSFLSSPIA
jgi:sulfatase maturation enzyme AslB (radical SAM superfamily)